MLLVVSMLWWRFSFQIRTKPVGWDNATDIYRNMDSIFLSNMFIERIMYHIFLQCCGRKNIGSEQTFQGWVCYSGVKCVRNNFLALGLIFRREKGKVDYCSPSFPEGRC